MSAIPACERFPSDSVSRPSPRRRPSITSGDDTRSDRISSNEFSGHTDTNSSGPPCRRSNDRECGSSSSSSPSSESSVRRKYRHHPRRSPTKSHNQSKLSMEERSRSPPPSYEVLFPSEWTVNDETFDWVKSAKKRDQYRSSIYISPENFDTGKRKEVRHGVSLNFLNIEAGEPNDNDCCMSDGYRSHTCQRKNRRVQHSECVHDETPYRLSTTISTAFERNIKPCFYDTNGTNFDEMFVSSQNNHRVVFQPLPIVPEDEAKQILERYVSRKSFYGKKAAKKCQVLSYDHGCAFRYVLHSLTESRSVSGSTEPYKDQNIDGPDNGDMPDIWTVGKPPPPSVIVKNETHTYRIPHTSKIITCGECQGKGTGPCRSCDGMGVRTCQYCNGNRYHEVTEAVHAGAGNYGTPTRQEFRHVQKPCHHCHGSGDMTCYTCNGHRTENCHKCMGRKRLVRYKVVTVKWETNTSGHVSDTAGIPQSKLLTCRGKQIFYKEKEKLNGLYSNDILHVETQAIAKKYLAQHQKRYKTIIRQCHSVDIIQTTTVQYAYRDRFYKFVIYGPDKAVYASDYPQRTFFGCSMM